MRRLVLFDVDGTVTPPRGISPPFMMNKLRQLRKEVDVGFIGGSTLRKLQWQLGSDVCKEFPYVFAECGLIAYKHNVQLPHERFVDLIGEGNYKALVNFILHYIADLDLPIKRGTFIEYRDGLINVCPQGRDTTSQEQERFEQFDQIHLVRAKMMEALKTQFPSLQLVCAIGGRTSFDVFPRGWDKTYALRHLEEGHQYGEIHYFGDKPHLGGNDYEMFHDPRIIGHAVDGPEDTVVKIETLFLQSSSTSML